MSDDDKSIERDLDVLAEAVIHPRSIVINEHVAAVSRMLLRLADEVWPQQTLEPDHQGALMTDKNPANILPTIGRHVHYVAHGSADGTYPSVCRVAIVTEVKDMVEDGYGGRDPNTDRVSLCVLNPTGMFFSQDLPYADPREMKGGTWHWPCVKADETPGEGRSIAVTSGPGGFAIDMQTGEYVGEIPQGKTMTLGPNQGMGPVEPYEPPRCHAARDGECHWEDCPQIRDDEPARTMRHCPLDNRDED